MLSTAPLLCANRLEIWKPETLGTLKIIPGLYRDCFTFFTFLYAFEAGRSGRAV
jgi:hypothetical protein